MVIGQKLFQNLRKFNRAIVPVFTDDDSNNLWGTGNADLSFSGEMAQIFVSGNGFGDGTKAMVADISVAYISAGDFNDSSKYMPLNFNVNEAKGLKDVVLSEYTVSATNVRQIAAYTPTAKLGVSLNQELDFGVKMANAARWVLKNSAGATVTITSVVDVPGLGWTVTIDSTAYTALASGAQLFLSWIDPTTLDAADVTGVENVDPLILTKP